MAELTNPHDRFFKDLLGHPEAARDFLIHYPAFLTTPPS